MRRPAIEDDTAVRRPVPLSGHTLPLPWILMSLPLPTSLSPSKVSSFKDCALAFRFSAIDHLPEPPSIHAVKGTLVHRALELLMWEEEPGGRTLDVAMGKLARAAREIGADPEYAGLELD